MKTICSLLLISLFLGGCARVFLPYEEDAACKRGVDEGMCASMTEVYDDDLEKHPGKERGKK